MVYRFAWRNNSKRATLYGRTCTVVVRGKMNSALVEFENGQREVVSRNALRRATLPSASMPDDPMRSNSGE